MMEYKAHFPDFYVTAPQPCPYLRGRCERKLFTHLTRDKPAAVVDGLLKSGFRRSQNIAYLPYCEGCQACMSVRILVNEFRPSRAMRRTWQKNVDLSISRIAPIATPEQYALFRRYVTERHADGGMVDMTYFDYTMMVEDSVVRTFLSEYRLRPGSRSGEEGAAENAPLAAAVLCDRLSDGISMVYSFYDPKMLERGLGTYMILDHIEYARKTGLSYVYLGYWIAGSEKMAYKSRFRPQERLGPGGWTRVE